MFVAVTKLFGSETVVHLESIHDIARWAEFHNLEFHREPVREHEETFNVFSADHSPLTPEAIARLLECKFRCVQPPWRPALQVGDGHRSGQAKAAIGRMIRDARQS